MAEEATARKLQPVPRRKRARTSAVHDGAHGREILHAYAWWIRERFGEWLKSPDAWRAARGQDAKLMDLVCGHGSDDVETAFAAGIVLGDMSARFRRRLVEALESEFEALKREESRANGALGPVARMRRTDQLAEQLAVLERDLEKRGITKKGDRTATAQRVLGRSRSTVFRLRKRLASVARPPVSETDKK